MGPLTAVGLAVVAAWLFAERLTSKSFFTQTLGDALGLATIVGLVWAFLVLTN